MEKSSRELTSEEGNAANVVTATVPSIDMPSPSQDLVIHQENDDYWGADLGAFQGRFLVYTTSIFGHSLQFEGVY